MRALALTLFVIVAAGPAWAQRAVVVPADAEVVVPARGASGPRLVHAPRPRIPSRQAAGLSTAGGRPMLAGGGALGGSGLAVPALIALPIAAAAAVAASMPGSANGSTSAPTRTR